MNRANIATAFTSVNGIPFTLLGKTVFIGKAYATSASLSRIISLRSNADADAIGE